FIVINIFFGDRREKLVKQPLLGQVRGIINNEKLWVISLWYFITFGSFVAFTVFLPNFLITNYAVDIVDTAVRAAGLMALATLIRPLVGFIGDRLNPLIALIYTCLGITFGVIFLPFSPTFLLFSIGCLLVAATSGIGNGLVFKP